MAFVCHNIEETSSSSSSLFIHCCCSCCCRRHVSQKVKLNTNSNSNNNGNSDSNQKNTTPSHTNLHTYVLNSYIHTYIHPDIYTYICIDILVCVCLSERMYACLYVSPQENMYKSKTENSYKKQYAREERTPQRRNEKTTTTKTTWILSKCKQALQAWGMSARLPGRQSQQYRHTDRPTYKHTLSPDGRTDGTDRLKQTSQYPTKQKKNKQATWNPCKTKQTTSGRVENNSRSSISFCFALELELVPIINALHGDKPSALCPKQERLFAFHMFYSRRRRTCNT